MISILNESIYQSINLFMINLSELFMDVSDAKPSNSNPELESADMEATGGYNTAVNESQLTFSSPCFQIIVYLLTAAQII